MKSKHRETKKRDRIYVILLTGEVHGSTGGAHMRARVFKQSIDVKVFKVPWTFLHAESLRNL